MWVEYPALDPTTMPRRWRCTIINAPRYHDLIKSMVASTSQAGVVPSRAPPGGNSTTAVAQGISKMDVDIADRAQSRREFEVENDMESRMARIGRKKEYIEKIRRSVWVSVGRKADCLEKDVTTIAIPAWRGGNLF